MAKGKGNGGASAASAGAGKNRKPRFKGANHPKNCPKAFRCGGNKELIRAFLGKG